MINSSKQGEAKDQIFCKTGSNWKPRCRTFKCGKSVPIWIIVASLIRPLNCNHSSCSCRSSFPVVKNVSPLFELFEHDSGNQRASKEGNCSLKLILGTIILVKFFARLIGTVNSKTFNLGIQSGNRIRSPVRRHILQPLWWCTKHIAPSYHFFILAAPKDKYSKLSFCSSKNSINLSSNKAKFVVIKPRLNRFRDNSVFRSSRRSSVSRDVNESVISVRNTGFSIQGKA